MEEGVPPGQAGMSAVVGLELSELSRLCEEASRVAPVTVACVNAPRHTVVSGWRNGLDALADLVEESGGAVVPLAIEIPCHSPLLAPVAMAFRSVLDGVVLRAPRIPVVNPVTGSFVEHPDDVSSSMTDQLTCPVDFERALRTAAALGVRELVQCGPGRALLSYAKRIAVDPPFASSALEDKLAGHVAA